MTAIINVPASITDPQLRTLLAQLRAQASSAPTAAQLQAMLLEVRNVNTPEVLPPGAYAPPGPITNLVAYGMYGGIMLTWDTVYSGATMQPGISSIEVWRSDVDDRDSAVKRLTVTWDIAFDVVEPGEAFYYWVRGVSLGGVPGPFNALGGVRGEAVIPAAVLLDQLTDLITASQLHADLRARIDLIDADTVGLVDQSAANATNIINEANARLSLAQQLRGDYTGGTLSGVSTGLLRQEVIAREASMNQLSQQLALLTAGSNNQFDSARIWHFNSGVEGWSSGTVVGGFFRPTPGTNVTPVVTFPAVSGSQYSQVRMRIRRVGSPTTWVGHFQYTTSSGTNSSSFDAPTFEADIAYLTRTGFGPWVNDPSGITSIGFRLYETTTATDYYEIDWIAIGRPAPGASTAELLTEQLARIDADNALSSTLTVALAQLAGKAAQSALDVVSARVTTTENTLALQGSALTGLEGSLGVTSLVINPSFAVWTSPGSYPDNWSAWSGSGMSQHTGAYAYSGGKALQFAPTASDNSGTFQNFSGFNPEFIDFELVFTLVSGSLSGAGIHVDWFNTSSTAWTSVIALKDLYVASDILGKKIICKARVRRPGGYTGTFSFVRVYIMGNYSGSGLGALSAKTIVFDTVFATIPDASNAAIQSMDTRLTSAEGGLTSQNSQLLQLRNNIALNTNALDLSTWVAGSTGTQGVAGQQGYWEHSGSAGSGESRIVTAGNSGVPAGPFGSSELMWECQDVGDNGASGGYNVPLSPYNKISKHRGCVFATFVRHDGLTNGNFYHGADFSGVTNMAGAHDGNPYFMATPATALIPNRWYLMYGVVHPRNSTIADTGLSGIYDCTTGERVVDGDEFRMRDEWDGSSQIFRNYLYYSTDTGHKCWFSRPLVSPLDNAPTPHQLMRYDSRTYANSQAISSISSSVSVLAGQVTSQGNSIVSLTNDVAGKASSSALNSLSSRVDAAEGVNAAQASSINQLTANLPGGGNLIVNSDFTTNTTGWNFWNQGSGTSGSGRNFAGVNWTPVGMNQIGMNRNGQQTGVMQIYSNATPITPSTRYCFSANIAGHRCTLRLIIVWLDFNGVYITEAQNGSWNQAGGNNLTTGWQRQAVFGVSPSNAFYAQVILRGEDVGDTDEYLWLSRPMFSEVPATTTIPPAYSSSVSGAYAAISEEAYVRASETAGLMAQKFLKLDVNGHIAGYGAMNNGIESVMLFAFDRVAFGAPGTNSFGFIIEGNKVVMDGAYMKTASIDNAAIGSLAVSKLIGDTAQFVKLNVGTLVVDDIQGDSSSSYVLGPVTTSFDFGGASNAYGAAISQVPVGTISIPARLNNRPYGMQFFVQGTALKSVVGDATIVADFFESNPGASVLQNHTIPGGLSASSGAFAIVATYTLPNGSSPPNPTPADWASLSVGDVVTLYLNTSNFIEGRIASKVIVSQNNIAGPSNTAYTRGTVLVLEQVFYLGSVPNNGAGCVLQRRSTAGRLYKALGITLATSVYAASTTNPIRYNMSYYDYGVRVGYARSVYCTVGHIGPGACVNTSITYAIVAGR